MSIVDMDRWLQTRNKSSRRSSAPSGGGGGYDYFSPIDSGAMLTSEAVDPLLRANQAAADRLHGQPDSGIDPGILEGIIDTGKQVGGDVLMSIIDYISRPFYTTTLAARDVMPSGVMNQMTPFHQITNQLAPMLTVMTSDDPEAVSAARHQIATGGLTADQMPGATEVQAADYKDMVMGRHREVGERLGVQDFGMGTILSEQNTDRSQWPEWAQGLGRLQDVSVGMTADIGIDPVTYLTGGASGLGRTAVKGAMRLFIRESMGRVIATQGAKSLDDALRLLGKEASGMDRLLLERTWNAAEKAAKPGSKTWTETFNEIIGVRRTGALYKKGAPHDYELINLGLKGDDFLIATDSQAGRVVNTLAEIIEHKRFQTAGKGVTDEWLALVDGAKKGQLPMWTTGGLRPGVPVVAQTQRGGLNALPGTRGLFNRGRTAMRRKIVGRTAPEKYAGQADDAVGRLGKRLEHWESMWQEVTRPKLIKESPMQLAAARGSRTALREHDRGIGSYMHFIEDEETSRAVVRLLNVQQHIAGVQDGWSRVRFDTRKAFGNKSDETARYLNDVIRAANSNIALPDTFPKKLLETATDFIDDYNIRVTALGEALAPFDEELAKMVVDRAFFRPFIVEDEFRSAVKEWTRLHSKRLSEIVPSLKGQTEQFDMATILTKTLRGTEDTITTEDVNLFFAFVMSMTDENAFPYSIGEISAWRMRQTGRTTVTAIDGENSKVWTAFPRHDDLNESLMKTFKALQDATNTTVPRMKNVDAALVLDPAVMMEQYMGDVATAFMQRAMVGEAIRSGMMKPAIYGVNEKMLLNQAHEFNLFTDGAKVIEDADGWTNAYEMFEVARHSDTEVIELGMDVSVKVPRSIAGIESTRQTVAEMRSVIAAARETHSAFPHELENAAKRIVAESQGQISLDEAKSLALHTMLKGVDDIRMRAISGIRRSIVERQSEVVKAATSAGGMTPAEIVDESARQFTRQIIDLEKAFDKQRAAYVKHFVNEDTAARAINAATDVFAERVATAADDHLAIILSSSRQAWEDQKEALRHLTDAGEISRAEASLRHLEVEAAAFKDAVDPPVQAFPGRDASGGQLGPDSWTLEESQKMGRQTGGTAPQGYKTRKGKEPERLKKLGLTEGDSTDYRVRTIANVDDAKVTVAYYHPSFDNSKVATSAGTRKTIIYAVEGGEWSQRTPATMWDWWAANMQELGTDLGVWIPKVENPHRPVIVFSHPPHAGQGDRQLRAAQEYIARFVKSDLDIINHAGPGEYQSSVYRQIFRKRMTLDAIARNYAKHQKVSYATARDAILKANEGRFMGLDPWIDDVTGAVRDDVGSVAIRDSMYPPDIENFIDRGKEGLEEFEAATKAWNEMSGTPQSTKGYTETVQVPNPKRADYATDAEWKAAIGDAHERRLDIRAAKQIDESRLRHIAAHEYPVLEVTEEQVDAMMQEWHRFMRRLDSIPDEDLQSQVAGLFDTFWQFLPPSSRDEVIDELFNRMMGGSKDEDMWGLLFTDSDVAGYIRSRFFRETQDVQEAMGRVRTVPEEIGGTTYSEGVVAGKKSLEPFNVRAEIENMKRTARRDLVREADELKPPKRKSAGGKKEWPVTEEGKPYQRTTGAMDRGKGAYLWASPDFPQELEFPRLRREVLYQSAEDRKMIKQGGIGQRMVEGADGMITAREADQLAGLPSVAGLSEGPAIGGKQVVDPIMDRAAPAQRSGIRFTDLSLAEYEAVGERYWMTADGFEEWVRKTHRDVFGTRRDPMTTIEDMYRKEMVTDMGDAARVTLADLDAGAKKPDEYAETLAIVAESLDVDVHRGIVALRKYVAESNPMYLQDPDAQGLMAVAAEMSARTDAKKISRVGRDIVEIAADAEAEAVAHGATVASKAKQDVAQRVGGDFSRASRNVVDELPTSKFKKIPAASADVPHQVFGQYWDIPGDVIVVTTNAYVGKNGAVMGRGIAGEAKKRNKQLPRLLEKHLKRHGNVVGVIGKIDGKPVIAFPVKPEYSRKPLAQYAKGKFQMRHGPHKGEWMGFAGMAEERLIRQSAQQLKDLVDARGWTVVPVPRAGTGAGALDWARDVAPIFDEFFDDRYLTVGTAKNWKEMQGARRAVSQVDEFDAALSAPHTVESLRKEWEDMNRLIKGMAEDDPDLPGAVSVLRGIEEEAAALKKLPVQEVAPPTPKKPVKPSPKGKAARQADVDDLFPQFKEPKRVEAVSELADMTIEQVDERLAELRRLWFVEKARKRLETSTMNRAKATIKKERAKIAKIDSLMEQAQAQESLVHKYGDIMQVVDETPNLLQHRKYLVQAIPGQGQFGDLGTLAPAEFAPIETMFGYSGGKNVGRGAKAYKKGKYGNRASHRAYAGVEHKTDTVEEAVEWYHGWLWDHIETTGGWKAEMLDDFPPGAKIRCPTKSPHSPCHAEVLAEAIDWVRGGKPGRAPSPGSSKMDSLIGTIGEEKAKRTVDVSALLEDMVPPEIQSVDDLFVEIKGNPDIDWFIARKEALMENVNLASEQVSNRALYAKQTMVRLRQIQGGQAEYPALHAAFKAKDWAEVDRLWARGKPNFEALGSVMGEDAMLVKRDMADGSRILRIDYPKSEATAVKDFGGDFNKIVTDMSITDEQLVQQGLESAVKARKIRAKIEKVPNSETLETVTEAQVSSIAGEVAAANRVLEDYDTLTGLLYRAIEDRKVGNLRKFIMGVNKQGPSARPAWRRITEALEGTPELERLHRWVEAAWVADLDHVADDVFKRWWQRERVITAGLEWTYDQMVVMLEAKLKRATADLALYSPEQVKTLRSVFDHLITETGQMNKLHGKPVTGVFDDSFGPQAEGLGIHVVPRMRKGELERNLADASRLGTPRRAEEILRSQQRFYDQLYRDPTAQAMAVDPRLGEVFPGAGDFIGKAAEEARINSRFIDEMLESGAPSVVRLPQFPLLPAESLGVGTGIARNFDIDPAFADVLSEMMNNANALHTPLGIKLVSETARTVTEIWKRWATIVRPSFHIRNLIGGIWNGLYIGVGPYHYAKMTPEVMKFRRNLRHLETRGGRRIKPGLDAFDEILLDGIDDWAKPYFREAWDQGVLQTSFARAENLYDAGRKGSWNILDPNMHVYKWGGRTMETFEDVMRMAAFYKWFNPEAGITGGTFAKEMVNAVHFDYSALTNIEQRIKLVIPFYVWSRRNIPLQLSMLMQTPAFIMTYEHARQNFNKMMAPEDDPWSAYQMERGWMLPLLRGNDDSWARLLWDPDLPFLDLERIPIWSDRTGSLIPIGTSTFMPGQWFQNLIDMAGPLVSVPLSMSEYSESGTVNAPAGVNEVLRAVSTVIPGWGPTSAGDMRVPREFDQFMHGVFPWYDDYRAMLGVKPNNPYRASAEGWVEGDTQSPWLNMGLGMTRTVGRGAGAYWYTPRDIYFPARETKDLLDQSRMNVRFQK